MTDDLEVRELRYFRAVAEELNFSKAAERLGMAQPPLSRAIRQLERRLGVPLFERTTHNVTLTPAGLTLLEESARVLDAISAATRRTRRARNAPRLIVTAKPGVATDLLRRILEQSDVPAAEIVLSGFGEQTTMVRDGRADLAIIGSPFDNEGLEIEPLLSEPRVAALPVHHELTHRPTLSCRDIAGLPVPRCPSSSAAVHAYWSGRDISARTDEAPATGPTVYDSAQLLEAVALGQAVALIPRSLAERNARDDIAYRTVQDASPYLLGIAWRAGIRSTPIAHLVRTAIEVAAADSEEVPGREFSGV
ncbi:LysR family transcriptional regulator [Actinoallomurus acanthiterrae]